MEIEKWRAHEAQLQREFSQLVGESSPFLNVLLKLYKKKIKRKKKSAKDNYDEDEDEDEEDSDDSDDDDSDMSDDLHTSF